MIPKELEKLTEQVARKLASLNGEHKGELLKDNWAFLTEYQQHNYLVRANEIIPIIEGWAKKEILEEFEKHRGLPKEQRHPDSRVYFTFELSDWQALNLSKEEGE